MVATRIHHPNTANFVPLLYSVNISSFFASTFTLNYLNVIDALLGNTEKKNPTAANLNFQKASFDEIAKHADSIVS